MNPSYDNRAGPLADIAHIANQLAANWKRIALATLAALLIGQTYLWLATPLYTSSAALFVDPRARKIDEVVPGDMGQDTTLLESQVAIITSDGVLQNVVETLKLSADPEFASEKSPLVQSITDALIPGRKITSAPERALTNLKNAVKVSRAKKTYVLDIAATSESPEKSSSIVTAIIDAYFNDQRNAKSDEAKRAQKLIDARLSELLDSVRQAELRADEYKKADKILTAEGGVITEQQLTQLSAELAVASAAMTETKAQRDQIQAAIKSGTEPDVLGEAGRTGLIARLREQYAEVARREASLSSQLQPSHPDMVDVRSQMRSIKSHIAAELNRVATAAEGAYQVAAARQHDLTRQLEKAKQELAQQNAAQTRARELQQEVTASRERLKNSLSQAKETQEQENMITPDARVISAPVTPTAPSKPTALFVLALSLLSGLTASALWAMKSSTSDKTLTSAAEFIEQTRIPNVWILPKLKKSRASLRGDKAYGSAYGDLLAALDASSNRDAATYRQAILRLLSKIKSLGRAGRPNTVMFTSPRVGAGNSASILAVAYSAALSGERVLLVDATSTNPELSSVFAAALAKSTTVVLDSKEHLNKIVTRDEKSGMSVLPIAWADLRTLRVQQRRRLVAGLNLLSQDYDWIFIDAGSLLDDEAATTLLPATDFVFLVGRVGATSRTDINEMLQMLEPAQDRIAGSILTFGKP